MRYIAQKCLLVAAVMVVVICSIWFSPIRHYWISVPSVTPEAIAAAVQNPDQQALSAIISATPYYQFDNVSPQLQHEQALKIEQGISADPVFGPRKIKLPFSEEDVVQGSGSWQWMYSGFALPEVLLKDYELTGNRESFLLAREMIYNFLLWEKNVSWPTGLVWNDHVLAGRIFVLSRFWSHYRTDKDYDVNVARELLQAVERIAARLASPEEFTFHTNHGAAQNLALIEAGLVFPDLPNAEAWIKLGKSRLIGQMGFYVSPEGFVLEHSPHYHRFGLALLDSAIALDDLSGNSFPASWGDLLGKVRFAEAWMRRPDGSLPVFGDTRAGPLPAISQASSTNPLPDHGLVDQKAKSSLSLFPISGIGGWSSLSPDGKTASQSVASWAFFQGHGHAHADELSIALWRDGGPEVLNAGYWPYDLPGRDEVQTWKGGNAPHFAGEPVLSTRPTGQLMAYSDNLDLLGLVVSRSGTKGTVQRQFFQLGKDNWIVLDVFQGLGKDTPGEIVWRTYGNLVEQASDKSTTIWLDKGQGRFRGTFIGAASIKPCSSQTAFAVFVDGLKPVTCVAVASAPSPSAVLSIWSASAAAKPNGATENLKFVSADEWEISGLADKKWASLVRKENRLILTGIAGNTLEVNLKAAPDVGAEQQKLHQAWLAMAKQYPRYYEINDYRLQVTYACLVLAGLQLIVLFAIARFYPSLTNKFVVLSLLAWIGLGAYLHTVYFVVS